MSSELAVLEIKAVTITSEETDLIKRTICAEATDAEMKLFFYDCTRRGVHPLDRLIHFTKRGPVGQKKYVPITSIDFFRIRAHGSGVFDGEEPAEYVLNEKDGLPDLCNYIVYRSVNGQRRAWHATARWSEYYPGEQLGFNWRKMPFLMLAKCAEALALRKAFPAELQGLYVKEEMEHADLRPHGKKPSEITARLEAQPEPLDSVEQHTVAVSNEAASLLDPPPNDVFSQSSAIAEHEAALDECKTSEEYQKAWDDIVKDKRLTSETRKPLYDKMQKGVKALRAKK